MIDTTSNQPAKSWVAHQRQHGNRTNPQERKTDPGYQGHTSERTGVKMTIAKEEQLGLALSGGGFRASLFHLGGFWRLNESGKLAEVDAISAVSAGGLVAVILATRWGKLNFENQRATNFREEITEPVLQLCGRNLDVSSAIAGLVVGPIVLEKRFENLLVGKLTLGQLPSHPNFIFNACHLETESNWSFSRSGIDAGEMGIIQATDFPIAKLLAAACSLPPALPPVRIRLHSKLFSEGMLPDLNRGTVFKTATLADAGLCDGLGVQAIGHMKHLLVSDGTRSFKRAGIPPWEVWTSRITNPLHTALEQNRRLRLEQLETDIKRGDKQGAFWALRTDPGEQHDSQPHFNVSQGWAGYMTSMRTRLAAFTEVEQKRLVNWGYIQCDLAVRSSYNNLPDPEGLPFPEYGFTHEPEEKPGHLKRYNRKKSYRNIRNKGRPASG